MVASIISVPVMVDVMQGKCHILKEVAGGIKESIYCSDTIFEAINYIVNNSENTVFYMSDVANLWVDVEAHEAFVIGMKQKPYLFDKCA